MSEHIDNKKILMVPNFDASELFSAIMSPEASQFHDLAEQLGATIAPVFSATEKKKLRDEFAAAAADMEQKMVWLVFQEDIDQDAAIAIITRFGEAGLANTGMMHVDFSPMQKNPAPGFNL